MEASEAASFRQDFYQKRVEMQGANLNLDAERIAK